MINRRYSTTWVSLLVAILALFMLAGCAQRGDDFFDAERFEAAADMYIKAAEQGDVDKMLQLGGMYAAGKIAYRRDYRQALHWYQQAAAQGVVPAMFELGFMFEYGQGDIDRDLVQAEYWYRQAAGHGHAYSQYRLAEVLAQQLDRYDSDAAVRSYSWFLIAAHTAQTCEAEPLCKIVSADLFNYRWQLQQYLPEQQQLLAQQQALTWSTQAAD